MKNSRAEHRVSMLTVRALCQHPQTYPLSEADSIPKGFSDEDLVMEPLYPLTILGHRNFHALKEGGGGAQSTQSMEPRSPEEKAR